MTQRNSNDLRELGQVARQLGQAADKLDQSAERLGEGGGSLLDDKQLGALGDSLLEGFSAVAGSIFGEIENGFNGLASSLLGLLGNFVSPGLGLLGDILKIFGFAEGGFVNQPTLAVVGEAGPEYIIPERKLAAALSGGGDGLAGLLGGLRGAPIAQAQAVSTPATTTIIQHHHHAPAIGSLDELRHYNRRAESDHRRGFY